MRLLPSFPTDSRLLPLSLMTFSLMSKNLHDNTVQVRTCNRMLHNVHLQCAHRAPRKKCLVLGSRAAAINRIMTSSIDPVECVAHCRNRKTRMEGASRLGCRALVFMVSQSRFKAALRSPQSDTAPQKAFESKTIESGVAAAILAQQMNPVEPRKTVCLVTIVVCIWLVASAAERMYVKRNRAHDGALEVRVSKAKNAGMGLFAKNAIAAGSLLDRYDGEVLTSLRFRKRYPKQDIKPQYVWQLDGDVFVDAADKAFSNRLRFVNHSDDAANVEVFIPRYFSVVYYYAAKDIAVGEEVFADYGGHFWEARSEG